ncbi:T9SS type A sorting domain-containing protein [Hanstruepera ponticola]|uniref:T9SS type A sorting domain-containing protein n=1 Tax=Hanstruepera ponticola TaxID=2042995 RepID=UPI00177DCCEC|nr:T9SS type A sorting domain-containing protein [Hanstruepera ponticola]
MKNSFKINKITICILLLIYPIIYISAQVCPPSVLSSGQGSHNLTIVSSDEDFIISEGECVDLTASFNEIGQTNTYAVRSIPYNPSYSFGDVGTDTGLYSDDQWSQLIPLGFNFTFYQQCYTESRLSTNGVVSFDPTLLTNEFHFWTPAAGATIPNNTDAALRDGNIFGAIHDLFPLAPGVDPDSYFITYGVKGEAPFRVFTYNFYNVPQYSCTNLRTSQQIFLYETTNVVEVYIYSKPACNSWAGGRAALGIQNMAGTQGLAPPERNTEQWEVTNFEAWQFYPTGDSVNEIRWYDDTNTVIGTGNSINVCPTRASNYTAELTYTVLNSFCQETTVVVTRCVTINMDGSEAAAFELSPTCDGATATIIGESGGVFSLVPDSIGNNDVVIDPDTGEVTNGIPDTNYCVEYTVTNSEVVSSISCFEVLSATDASFFMTPTCDGGTVNITGTQGGVFSFEEEPIDDAILNTETGTITGGTFGMTYIIRYTSPGACPDSSIQSVTVLLQDDASFYMTPTCDGAIATITGDDGGIFNFNPDPADGAVIDPVTGTVTGCIPGETYYVEYIANGTCSNSTIENFTAGCVGVIEVKAFIDENSNAIYDTSEMDFNQGVFTYEINNDGIIHYLNSNSDSFLIYVTEDGDMYDIGFTMYDEYNTCLSQTLSMVEDVTATNNETVQVEFPLEAISNCGDIAVYLTANASPRPGVLYNNTLTISNLGLLPNSGSIEFTYDPMLTLEGVYNVNSGNSVTNTTTGFILNFNDLQPGESETVTVRLDVPASIMAGDLLTNSVVYNISDLNIVNNESTLTQTVVNSYDPNDKMESHGPEIILNDFTSNDYLYYTIRFQNLGTAEAIDIRIEDLLDSQLSASTFKMLHASHDYVLTRIDNNLTWQFDDIDLPSESMDEPNSHGYVYFKIKPTPGYALGDVIPNFADIYFDFNPAITTNTFETEFVNNLSVTEFDSSQFSIYPNPTNDFLNVNMSNQIGSQLSVAIYDIQGKLISDQLYKTDTTNFQIDVSNLSTGLYVIKLYNEEFQEIKKLIIN